MDVRICDECQKVCQLLRSASNPMADEWYCSACHRSYLVHEPQPEKEPEVEHARRRR